jgi:hypothetical protein
LTRSAEACGRIAIVMADDHQRHIPPEVTGGKGFEFEDEVVAYFLTCLLARVGPWGGEAEDDGVVVSVACQQRNLGWQPDDVVLVLSDAHGIRRCALSIKDYAALRSTGITESRAKEDSESSGTPTLARAWRLYLGHASVNPPFDRERDLFGLVARDIAAGVREDWRVLRERAAFQEPESVHQTGLSKSQLLLFDAFACPEAVQDGMQASRDTALFLRCFRIMDYAQHRELAFRRCRDLVASGTDEDALRLWNDLLALAGRCRPAGAVMDLSFVLQRLRGRNTLKPYPDHRESWERLRQISDECVARINDAIDGFRFPRDQEQAELQARLDQPGVRVVALVGDSGCGKTVVAKRWRGALLSGRVVWWDMETLDEAGPTAFGRLLGLGHQLGDLLRAVPEARAYLVLDGLDRIAERAWENVAALLWDIGIREAESPWQVVATCETDSWESVRARLTSVGVAAAALHTLPVGLPSQENLGPVVQAFPRLRPLLANEMLRTFIWRPKVLALVVSNLKRGAEPDQDALAGESHLVKWIWEQEVERGVIARGQLAQLLATRQGDRVGSGIPLGEVGSADPSTLQALVDDKVCRKREERIYFTHDLYGDWARMMALVSHSEDIQEFLEPRLSVPLWQRALRLYGVRLLEDDTGARGWQDLFERLSKTTAADAAEAVLLDSLSTAVGAVEHIAEAWPLLLRGDGRLLRLFLDRFRHAATVPDESLLEKLLPDNPDIWVEARASLRVPQPLLWLPILQAIIAHREDVTALAPIGLAEVAIIWLRSVPAGFPHRHELAELAVTSAEQYAKQNDNGYLPHSRRRLPASSIYVAALMASSELPDRVGQFALGRVRRTQDAAGESPARTMKDPRANRDLPVSDHWPNGPRRRVDELFRNVFLDQMLFVHLFRSLPEIAKEVTLALLISPRDPDASYDSWVSFDDFDTERIADWTPAHPSVGPFEFLLREDPGVGVATIAELVNFATDRAMSSRSWAGDGGHIYAIPGWGEWAGNERVFCWYRDLLAPPPVACALMAVEKWLYDKLDAGEPVESEISMIASNSRSVAFAGLLAAVACRNPELLTGCLRPLLTVPEFHVWDITRRVQGHAAAVSAPLMAGMRGEHFVRTLQEWHELPHRRTHLRDMSATTLLTHPEMAPFVDDLLAGWRERKWVNGARDPLGDSLDWLIALHDEANYQLQEYPGQGTWRVFQPPAELAADRDEVLARLAPEQLTIVTAHECLECLQTGEAIGDAKAQRLWAARDGLLASLNGADGLGGQLVTPADSLCGVAAALLLLARNWLRAAPEREAWCASQIVGAVVEPHGPAGGPRIPAEPSATDFCARALPALWAEALDDVTVRKAVAYVALADDPGVVGMLLAGCMELRGHLGEEVDRLRYLVLLSVRAWDQAREAAHRRRIAQWRAAAVAPEQSGGQRHPQTSDGGGDTTQGAFSIEDWIREQVAIFVGRRQSSAGPGLQALARWRPPSRPSRQHERSSRDPGLALDRVAALYASLPPLSRAANSLERQRWREQWLELAHLAASMMSPDTPEDSDKELEGSLNEEETWIMRRLGHALLEMEEGDEPADLWRPLLEQGPPAQHWLDSFLSEFIWASMTEAADPAAFVRQWRSIIEWALSSDKWEHSSSRARWQVDDLWWDLLGFGNLYGIWAHHGEYASLVGQVGGLYARWATLHLACRRSRERVVGFLRQPIAQELLPGALLWLAQQGGSETPSDSQGEYENDLAALLASCWSRHEQTIRKSQELTQAMHGLLRGLHQNSVAMQVLDQMASGGDGR